jgi:hypothetical protein
VGTVLDAFSGLCVFLVGSKFLTADLSFIFDRYFHLLLTVIDLALLLNKNNQSLANLLIEM